MPLICTECGERIESNHKFCSNCGTTTIRPHPSSPSSTSFSPDSAKVPAESKDDDLQLALKLSLDSSYNAPPMSAYFADDDYLLALELQREEERSREDKLPQISSSQMFALTPNTHALDVKATFNYTDKKTLDPIPKRVLVKNARPLQNSGALDLLTNGFALVPQETSLTTADFYDNSAEGKKLREEIYYAEMESLIMQHTGADKVFILADQVRNNKRKDVSKQNAFSGGSVSGYASVVHSDYCAKRSTQSFLRANGAPANTRYMLINAWRNIDDANPIYNDTLACCDTTSVDDEQDLIRFDAPLKENAHCMSYKNGLSLGQCAEQYRMNTKHVDKHRWYYFPAMEKDEVLLFTQFDSDPSRSSRFTFHSAFHDSTVNQSMPSRQSIEIRAMCVFIDEDDDWGISHNLIKNTILDSIQLANVNDTKNIGVSLQMKLAVAAQRKILQPHEVDVIADAAALDSLEDIDVIINLCAERKHEFVLEDWSNEVIREELQRAKRGVKTKSASKSKAKGKALKKKVTLRCHHCGEPDSAEHHRLVHGHTH
mmetsp:Transcript_7792/g.14099  ORF Transcript_7792/g.14099 Transcript_7792/m.14099 type:complete len:543 (+) Transcript_7792:102-1730(+)|eukprot:CAMPEP_0182499390 /NCGR_PEP_ID=MMETSP1321-20130603/7612_1 /TAXON_ID=91990 /ORGANISM="Bolidomonas sp., Strain RCC1657" /LENGTH=542 /DNA_ID=CAMNT_0024703581 /DNA_START=63 /DNA_END=1691 /DNA_ORIENTATION=+